TPPHFWALALKYSDDYSAAGVPMLPVVQGRRRTTDQMFLYSVVLLAVSLLLVPVAHLGYAYLITALVLGVGLTAYSLRLRADPTDIKAMRMFHFSITYLVIVFVAVAVDRLIDAATPVVLYRPLMVVAWSTFVVFELAILISVLGYKRTQEGRWRAAAAELLWTAVPLVVVSALFLLAWQTGSLAAP
ncbi:MAG TPA: UbiA family prenyltransferase, partial [Actinomycetota bacterium]|nr:UbiA family prenyltransferase [Actinomycetota bacterium]